MSEQKKTQPYSITEDGQYLCYGIDYLATIAYSTLPEGEAQKQLRHVLRAVNFHEALVNALQAVVAYENDEPAEETYGARVYARAREVLRLADFV
jgi:hypothetical protein